MALGVLCRLFHRQRLPMVSVLESCIPVSFTGSCRTPVFFLYPYSSTKRWLSINSDWLDPPEFGGLNAYDVLGVSQTSSFEDIKASFRKLAKETHPDTAKSGIHSYDAKKFLLIVAAYEVLSDAARRAHYDRYILAQRTSVQKFPQQYNTSSSHNCYRNSSDEEVVEWLKWYRYTIKDILSERRVIAGSGYFDVLQRDFYSALHAAYFGPNIEPMDLLPNCFEAEERSTHTTSEVLHLVSGRYLFGIVCLATSRRTLPHEFMEKLESSGRSSGNLGDTLSAQLQCDAAEIKGSDKRSLHDESKSSDAYSDLELLICGRVVAKARRVLSKRLEDSDTEDQIFVFLNVEGQVNAYPGDESSPDGSEVPLGVIKGLGTTLEEGACYVYNATGMKTHMIMKHRTFLVKHLHWFRIGRVFRFVNADVVAPVYLPASFGCLSHAAPCMILVDGTSKHLEETMKGKQFHPKETGVILIILIKDFTQPSTCSLWPIELLILSMLQEQRPQSRRESRRKCPWLSTGTREFRRYVSGTNASNKDGNDVQVTEDVHV